MVDVPRKRVLSDHKKSGKKLVPPFTSQFGDRLQLTSWPRTGIPEIVWLALLHDHDEEFGVHAALALSGTIRKVVPTSKTAFCLISHFAALTDAEGKSIWAQLSAADRVILLTALQPLVAAYPTCPLNRLLKHVDDVPDLSRMKRIVSSLFDKTSRASTMALATMFYLTVNAGLFFLHPESRLLNLERIREYPSTEDSRLMATELRATTIMNFMPPQYEEHPWPKEFWNRGLELEPCTYE